MSYFKKQHCGPVPVEHRRTEHLVMNQLTKLIILEEHGTKFIRNKNLAK
jgi:hypothetical protein